MPDIVCKSITASGENCQLKAGPSGYCHVHDPQKIAERVAARQLAEEARQRAWGKGTQMREVLEVVKSTCNAKGWGFQIASLDEENWCYASVSVERHIRSGYSYETITGTLDITIDNGVKISCQKTSFHGHG